MIFRTYDIMLSLLCIFILSPISLLICAIVKLSSKGSIFYLDKRIGKNSNGFNCYKFRTMKPNSDNVIVTIGNNDPRVTKVGKFLRKYKLDELPQLFNILKGEMSFIGPRPDVEDYKHHYLSHYPSFYSLKPGLTSPGTLHFIDEHLLYVGVDDPDRKYVHEILPKKVALDKEYFENRTLLRDTILIFKTFSIIVMRR